MNTTTVTPTLSSPTLYIGITGRAGAGKDTFADMLEAALYKEYRVDTEISALAYPLKKAAAGLFGLPHNHFNDREFKERINTDYDLAPRQMLQKLGSAVRKEFGEDFFMRAWDTRLTHPGDVQILTDVRYTAEAKWWLSKPTSSLVVMHRTNEWCSTPHCFHDSEAGVELQDLLCPDRIYHVYNNSTLENLRILADKLAATIVTQSRKPTTSLDVT